MLYGGNNNWFAAYAFFAGPGDWTLRTLAPKAEPVETVVSAESGRDTSSVGS